MRRWLIIVFTFLGGIYFFLEFFLPKDILVGGTDIQLGRHHKEVIDVFRIVFVMSLGLGIINILRVYGSILIRGRKGWPNALALIVALLVTAVSGLWAEYGKSDGVKSFWDDFIYGGLMNNLSSAMFSLLAFYIASAAYRSFRVKSFEAALMMLAALVVMVGQIPLGFFVWQELPEVRNWMITWVSTPAFRGIFFGAAVAGLAMAVRMWLSLEKTGQAGGR